MPSIASEFYNSSIDYLSHYWPQQIFSINVRSKRPRNNLETYNWQVITLLNPGNLLFYDKSHLYSVVPIISLKFYSQNIWKVASS